MTTAPAHPYVPSSTGPVPGGGAAGPTPATPPTPDIPPAIPIATIQTEWRADPQPRLVGAAPAVALAASFRDPLHSAEPLPPSIALAVPLQTISPLPPLPAFPIRPEFADHEGQRLVRILLDAGTSLYGTGEVAGSLLRGGRRVILYNTDAFEYSERIPGLYQSHPWVLGVRKDGTAFGVLFDTTWRAEMILGENGESISIRADGQPFQVLVVERDTPQQVVSALADLTGHMPLPPRWALGYHQSRWSYRTEESVRSLAAEFRRRRIPCDVIWMDIDYMDGFRCFTFDPKAFPNPKALNADLHAQGFKSVWMIDPGIKVDPAYRVYESGKAGDHFVKNADGFEYHGQVWPGACAFPDFTRAETRRWWADLYQEFMATGIDGVWNDMNEPAVFDQPWKWMPADNLHRADPELGGPGPHTRYRNVYGMLMVNASREGMLRARPNRRPFVLTRSSHLGGHRYAATWTGDNQSVWPHLAWSIPMTLNMGLSGQPFAGPDIGGFSGNATGKLFARWMGIGALLPFARGHSIKDSADHEPWSFGPEVEETCRRALERRYRLLPYLYTLFHEASTTGLPVARPIFFANPKDPSLRDADDSFLLGDHVLVRCRVTEQGDCRSPFPISASHWLPIEPTPPDLAAPDPELPSLFLRAGSIVPLGPAMLFSDEKPLDPLTLLVALDETGHAQGSLYEDGGNGFDYLQGATRTTTYRAQRTGDAIEVSIASESGRLPRPQRALHVVILGPTGPIKTSDGAGGEHIRLVGL
jgi:alpha-glucosidase